MYQTNYTQLLEREIPISQKLGFNFKEDVHNMTSSFYFLFLPLLKHHAAYLSKNINIDRIIQQKHQLILVLLRYFSDFLSLDEDREELFFVKKTGDGTLYNETLFERFARLDQVDLIKELIEMKIQIELARKRRNTLSPMEELELRRSLHNSIRDIAGKEVSKLFFSWSLVKLNTMIV